MPGMPYHLEKGPLLSVLDSFFNGGSTDRLRTALTELRQNVPLSQVGQFSGQGGQLSARIAGAEQSVRTVTEKSPADAETKEFVSAITQRLTDLSAAVTAAEHMPASRRRAAHTAIEDQLDGIDADLMARLGVL